MATLTRWAWLRPVVTALSLLLGICAGSWGLTAWISQSIQTQMATKAALEQEIVTQEQTLAKITSRTHGVELHQDEKGRRFIILPPGAKPETGWELGKRPAVRY